MILSVIIQLALSRKYLGEVGVVPAAQRAMTQAGGRREPLTHDEIDRLRFSSYCSRRCFRCCGRGSPVSGAIPRRRARWCSA
jgi:hypothetical protein